MRGADVYTPAQRHGNKGLDHLKKASKLPESDKSRRLHMNEAISHLRKAAKDIEDVCIAEDMHEREGWSLWQTDIYGVETPVFV